MRNKDIICKLWTLNYWPPFQRSVRFASTLVTANYLFWLRTWTSLPLLKSPYHPAKKKNIGTVEMDISSKYITKHMNKSANFLLSLGNPLHSYITEIIHYNHRDIQRDKNTEHPNWYLTPKCLSHGESLLSYLTF